jgi:hypothetical protein
MTDAEKKEAVQRAMTDAHQVLKQGADTAANHVVGGLKRVSEQAAIAAKMLVDRGIPPGQAISAAARVAGHQFMMSHLDPVGMDWAAISPASTQVTINRLRGEF